MDELALFGHLPLVELAIGRLLVCAAPRLNEIGLSLRRNDQLLSSARSRADHRCHAYQLNQSFLRIDGCSLSLQSRPREGRAFAS